jgi:hypothetical protein
MADLAYQHIADVHPGEIRRNFDRCGGWTLRGSAPANLGVSPSAYTDGTTIKIG